MEFCLMTTQLVPFQFGSHEIRTILVDGQPLFCARDVALALDYANPAEAYKAHCKHLKKLSYSKLLELIHAQSGAAAGRR